MYLSSNTLRGPVALAVVLLVGTISAAAIGQNEGSSSDFSTLYRDARDAYHQAKFTQCIQALNDLMSSDDRQESERIQCLELQASCRVAVGDVDGARPVIEEIVGLDPEYRMNPDAVPPALLMTFYRVLDDQERLGYDGNLQTVAILDLKNHSITEHDAMEALGGGLADAIITRLSGATSVRVVERERLNYIREEIGLNRTQEFDQGSAVRAGKLLGAQSFVMGGFTRLDDKIRIDARLVRTETGEVIKTHTVEGKVDNVFEIVNQLAQDVATALGEVKALPRDENDHDVGVGAMIEYARGLERLDNGELTVAYEHFQLSLAAAPGFENASRRMRQLEPLLVAAESSEL
jgi:TolB-like protein